MTSDIAPEVCADQAAECTTHATYVREKAGEPSLTAAERAEILTEADMLDLLALQWLKNAK